MFSKALILVLLGSTLILAAPLANNEAPEAATEPSKAITDRLWDVWNKAADQATRLLNKGKATVSTALNEVKAQGKYAVELGKDAYEYLKEKGAKLADESAKAIQAEKDKWVKKIEELKNSTVETGQVLAYKIKQLEQQAEQGLKNQLKKAEEEWEQWKKETHDAYKAEEAKKNQPK